MPARETCLAAVDSRDARFDGAFVTGVTSTGIYCRPSCPARTPSAANCTFHPSAAAAQAAGFRACKRCRPDAAPGSAEWEPRADVTARVVRLIADGVVDRDGVAGLARRVGYSPRQLERLTLAELGATPIGLARAQRAHTARLLLQTTDLAMADVAFAAGFGSIRSFNATLVAAYAATPSGLRDAGGPSEAGASGTGAVGGRLLRLDVRLPVRPPFCATHLFGHLVATGVPGVEEWRGGAYRRTLRLPHGPGIAALTPRPDHVAATLHLSDPRDLTPAIGRCRRMLDLDADPVAVDALLARDPVLAPLVAADPGCRVPRSADPDELALRVVLGQQVSTAAARTAAGRLVARLGEPIADPEGGLTHVFPTADAVAGASVEDYRAPASRRLTLIRLAAALASGSLDLGPGADRDEARAGLAALPGIGPWTVEMVAMRSLGDPDAFPATDLGVRRAAAGQGLPDGRALTARAERWRPWRAYATVHLWSTLDHAINRLPADPEEDA